MSKARSKASTVFFSCLALGFLFLPAAGAQFSTKIIGDAAWWDVGNLLEFRGPNRAHHLGCSCTMMPDESLCWAEDAVWNEVTIDGDCTVVTRDVKCSAKCDLCDLAGGFLPLCYTNPECEDNKYCGSVWEITSKQSCGVTSSCCVYTIVVVCEGDPTWNCNEDAVLPDVRCDCD